MRSRISGASVAVVGHVLALIVCAVLALAFAAPDNAYDEDRTWFFLYGMLLAEIVLLVVLLIAVPLVSRTRRPVGNGMLLGWGAGLLVMPLAVPLVWSWVIHPGGSPMWIASLFM